MGDERLEEGKEVVGHMVGGPVKKNVQRGGGAEQVKLAGCLSEIGEFNVRAARLWTTQAEY